MGVYRKQKELRAGIRGDDFTMLGKAKIYAGHDVSQVQGGLERGKLAAVINAGEGLEYEADQRRRSS